MPPMSWTSKWRISSLRFAISRQTAKASVRMSSSVAPSARRFLNSSAFARRSRSESRARDGSLALISATSGWRRLSSRSFLLPKILLSRTLIMPRLCPQPLKYTEWPRAIGCVAAHPQVGFGEAGPDAGGQRLGRPGRPAGRRALAGGHHGRVRLRAGRGGLGAGQAEGETGGEAAARDGGGRLGRQCTGTGQGSSGTHCRLTWQEKAVFGAATLRSACTLVCQTNKIDLE